MFKGADQIQVSDIDFLGGKARGLLRLRGAGHRVPDFLILNADLIEKWRADRDARVLPAKVQESVNALPEAWLKDVAVRSSGVGEDSSEDSFAGIHESFLNVSGRAEIASAVLQVIQSAFHPRALDYRKQRGLSHEQVRIAVVLQKMIAPRFAGVSFGRHPVTGDTDVVWISATEGLGEKLVSGAVAGSEYQWRSGELQVQAPSQPLSESDFLHEVARQTQRLSAHERRPQDVEWAWDGRDLWILQTRPITTAAVSALSEAEIVFDNSNIQESYCGVTTPLTFSYASTAYAKVYDQNLKFMGVPEYRRKEAAFWHENLLGLIQGRVYYNINHWYAGLLGLPSFGKRKEEMEDMMGLEKPVEFVVDNKLATGEKLRRLPGVAYLLGKLIWKFVRLPALVREFDRWFWGVYRSADVTRLSRFNDRELLFEIHRLQGEFLEKWGIPILNDLRVMLMMGSVKRALRKHGLEQELGAVMHGHELESVKPTIELHRLAVWAGREEKIRQALSSYRGKALCEALRLVAPQFAKETERYVDLYGDRCRGELKLETVTMRQDPEIFYSLLRDYLKGGLHLKESILPAQKSMSENAAWIGLNRWTRQRLTKKVNALKVAVANRELLRFHRTRNFGLMRCLYLEVGERWARAGYLKSARDIFFLTIQEVEAFGQGRSVTRSLGALVELRRREFEAFEDVSVGAQVRLRFPVSGHEPAAKAPPVVSGNSLRGLGCAAGVIEGEIRFVETAGACDDLAGKILLAERTDPGWTPLFALVKGVIIERGSMLSHSAVIAREMGIPAVIAIADVTRILKDRDYVRLDGNQGTVEILRRAQGAAGCDHSADQISPI